MDLKIAEVEDTGALPQLPPPGELPKALHDPPREVRQDLQPVVAGEDTAARLKKELRQYPLKREEREALSESIERAAAKVAAKLCYGLREDMEPELWKPCLEGLFRRSGS